MIYLDGDIQVYDNIDHLFDMPDGNMYGVVDCLCAGWEKPCLEKLSWPAELGPEPTLYFNAGMFVFEQSLSTATLRVSPSTAFAEQDFMNMFFKKIYKPIPPIYNFLMAMLWRHPDHVDLDQVKVVHYCAKGSKPWEYKKEEKNMDWADVRMLVNRWWDIDDNASLDSPDGPFTVTYDYREKHSVAMPSFKLAPSAA